MSIIDEGDNQTKVVVEIRLFASKFSSEMASYVAAEQGIGLVEQVVQIVEFLMTKVEKS